MLETIALTFALLVAGASVRACGVFLFRVFSRYIDNWAKKPVVYVSPKLIEELKAKQNAEAQARADLKAFQEAGRNLNETRHALRSS